MVQVEPVEEMRESQTRVYEEDKGTKAGQLTICP